MASTLFVALEIALCTHFELQAIDAVFNLRLDLINLAAKKLQTFNFIIETSRTDSEMKEIAQQATMQQVIKSESNEDLWASTVQRKCESLLTECDMIMMMITNRKIILLYVNCKLKIFTNSFFFSSSLDWSGKEKLQIHLQWNER